MLRNHLPAYLNYLWNTHIALLIVTDGLDIVDANSASLVLSGYHHHHMIGKPLAQFLEVTPTTATQLEHIRQNYRQKTRIDDNIWTLVRQNEQSLEITSSRRWIIKHDGELFQVIVMMPAAEQAEVYKQLESAADMFVASRQHARAKKDTLIAIEALASQNLETIIALHRSSPLNHSQHPTPAVTTPNVMTPRVKLEVSNGVHHYHNVTVNLSDNGSQHTLYTKDAPQAYVISLTPHTPHTHDNSHDNSHGKVTTVTQTTPTHDNTHTHNNNTFLSDDALRQLVWDFR